jgi:hypothetical protein
MEERRGYPYAFDVCHRTKAGFEGRQASAWLDRFAARARQLRGSWGLGERPKTPRQRLRQAQLSPQLGVCFAFVLGPSRQARGKTRFGGVWRCEVGCPSPRRLEIVARNSSLRPPPGCVPKCVAHSGSCLLNACRMVGHMRTNEDRAASYLLRSRYDPRLTRGSLKGGESGNRPETGRADQSSPKVRHEKRPRVYVG